MTEKKTRALMPTETANMSPLAARALAILEKNPNPETLRELLSMQRDYEANEARKEYAAALVDLKRELPTVINRDKVVNYSSKGGQVNYTHASLAGVMEAITHPLTQFGFTLDWRPSTGQGLVTVTCRLTHAAGHFEECAISAPVDTSGSKSAAQGTASTITLLQRYTALALLGIATADMVEPTGADFDADPGAESGLSVVARWRERFIDAAEKSPAAFYAVGREANQSLNGPERAAVSEEYNRIKAKLESRERDPGSEG